MQFALTQEQKMIQEAARDFAQKEIAPVAADLDKEEKFPTQIVKQLGQLGLMGMTVPTEYGGGGMDNISYVLALEEIARACASTAIIMSVHNSLVTYPVYEFGSDEIKKKYLPALAKGEKLGAFSLTEPNAGSDAGNQQTTAVEDGDHYVINGTKIFVTTGDVADYVLLFASTDKSLGPKGITAFLVEKDWEGFKVGSIEHKLGIRASSTCELVLSDMRVPKANVLGAVGQGFKIALRALDGGRIGVAAQAVGIAQAAFETAVRYSKQREQFGKPISVLQAIQWMIADMAVNIQAARLLLWEAAYAKDTKKFFSKEAAMAKLFASEVASKCASEAIQIHGGYGYSREYSVERNYRDARITQIYEGTSEVQKLVIAATVLKEIE
ncbi:MAG: acyl-CoA dehydrogenase [Candidatus Eiseniibacteriota bacterium]|nr:MAG: acyl-CoA dehydrogenase [Candidatus Eisenbacteria bacterium]